jgi:hypothetical protein
MGRGVLREKMGKLPKNTGSVIIFRPAIWIRNVECPSHMILVSVALALGGSPRGNALDLFLILEAVDKEDMKVGRSPLQPPSEAILFEIRFFLNKFRT